MEKLKAKLRQRDRANLNQRNYLRHLGWHDIDDYQLTQREASRAIIDLELGVEMERIKQRYGGRKA